MKTPLLSSCPPARRARLSHLLLAAMAGSSNAAAASDAVAAAAPEVVEITGTRERAYRATIAPTANKSDTTIKETPFSIQTVTRELIEDRGVISFGEAVRTVPGLTPQVGWGAGNDRFRLRGFATSSNLKNGFRRSVFAPMDELVNIEQIEVLKGPASALYGRFEPGGVVNLVTKKPLASPATRLELSAGGDGLRRATLDDSGAVSGTLRYRLTGAWQDSDGFRDFADARSRFVSPVLQWKPDAATTLTVELEAARRRGAFDRGLGNDLRFLQVPIRTSYGERDARLASDSRLASAVLEHRLASGWELRAGAQFSDAETDALWYPYGWQPIGAGAAGQPVVNRRKQRNVDRQIDATAMAEAAGRFSTGSVRHRLLLGAETGRERWDYSVDTNIGPFGFATNLPIDLFNPVHGAANAGPLTRTAQSQVATRNAALYLQDEAELSPHWRLLLGLRHDRTRAQVRASHLRHDPAPSRKDHATSPRLGLTYTPAAAVSVYASWARSFLLEPSGGLLREGGLPAPSRGRQTEAGVKLSLLGGRLEPTLAVFDIRRSKGIVSDPDDFDYVIQVGEQRSRGWELDLPYSITPRWRLLASYSRLKAEISADSDPTLVGKILANAPRRTASAWTTWDLGGSLAGLSLGAGATHVGERQANTLNSFVLPAYTRWDANAALRFGARGRYKLQLTVQNLGGKRYYDSGGAFVPTYPGAPRTVIATMGAAFR